MTLPVVFRRRAQSDWAGTFDWYEEQRSGLGEELLSAVQSTSKSIGRYKLKHRVRELTRRTRGTSIGAIVAELRETLLGWKAYFGIAEVLSPLRDIDKWVRRKLRCYLWKQWGPSGYRELRKRGVSVREAWNTSKSAHGPWRLSKTPASTIALPLSFFTDLGLPNLAPRKRNLIHRTAGYVTRTSGGVGGRGPEASSYPD